MQLLARVPYIKKEKKSKVGSGQGRKKQQK